MFKKELSDSVLHDVQGGVFGYEDRPVASRPHVCGACGSSAIRFAPDEMDNGFHLNGQPSWVYYCYDCKKCYRASVLSSAGTLESVSEVPLSFEV